MTATRLSNRAVIRLSPQAEGEDVAEFLQGLVTHDVTGDLPVWAGLLSPQGKALFDFIVWRDGSELLLDCETEAAAALIKRLGLYRLRRKIAIGLDPALTVHWSASHHPGGVPDPRMPGLGWRWLAPESNDDSAADAAWLACRLGLGVAEGRAELGDGETLWLECNADHLHGVSFTKGCYVGQENTARMNWRQKVNRRLVVVPIARSDPARQRAAWPEFELALDHLRVEDIAPDLRPRWLQVE
jgi:folate-binding protein YgfZ